MVSRTIAFYGPQVTEANEESPPKSSLALTLTQHPRDEEPEPREVRVRLEVEPPRAWYYRIFSEIPHPGDLVVSRPRFW
jgi:hypothetical protein